MSIHRRIFSPASLQVHRGLSLFRSGDGRFGYSGLWHCVLRLDLMAAGFAVSSARRALRLWHWGLLRVVAIFFQLPLYIRDQGLIFLGSQPLLCIYQIVFKA